MSPAAGGAGDAERAGPGARPADVARRALREAREREREAREPQESDAAADATVPGEGSAREDAAESGAAPAEETAPGAADPTPGANVARAALAAAATTSRPPAPPAAARTTSADEPAPEDAPPPSPGARPGDVAREALRAARARAVAEEGGPAPAAPAGRADDEHAATGDRSEPRAPRTGKTPSSRGTRPASAPRARTARRGAPQDPPPGAASARAVRELLAGAFKLPTGTDTDADPETDTETGSGTDEPDADRTPNVQDTKGSWRKTPAPSPAPAAARAPEPAARPDDGPEPAPEHAARRTPDAPRPAAVPEAAPPAAAPQSPRTMATPHRDGDLRRTFPAVAARATANDASFAVSWWGNAWVTALEEGALDTARLTRGRAYAQGGHVDAITVTPGLVLAYVKGSRVRPYRVQVRLRTLDDDEWERFLDAAADRPGHIAALLDGEVPPTLADCGVPLLPLPGDLDPHCSCPDSGHPCKHAAALCYQAARLLDADPFVLFLLRGRGEREVLDDLSRRSAARAARAAQEKGPAPLPGVRATEALAPRTLPPLPRPQQAPPHPEQPPVYPGVPGGPDTFALDQLATDAAARAHALLTTGHDPVGGLSLWEDAVRLAAARPGSGLTVATRTLYSSLSAAAGRSPGDLARAVAAWRQGGHEGLAVLEETWDPPAGRFDRARALLLAAGLPAFRPFHNRLTHPHGHVQLRFGRDGVWYAYESEPAHDDWWPRGTPDLDPVGALTGVAGPDGV
ncbi:SWIM zinc finger family protein [Streptomyces sp. NPDC008150]|uniref:SWIM zinc finger family protein n=1 Tax=Streptomyces sp. NPDC008150 TaxID=3364816 RepID=UPI0036F06FB9